LPNELKARHPSIQGRDMAAAGNVYRHEYEDVAVRGVWDTLRHHLPPLRAAIEQELAMPAIREISVCTGIDRWLQMVRA
jgi:uncharacterized protein with HEPN domain